MSPFRANAHGLVFPSAAQIGSVNRENTCTATSFAAGAIPVNEAPAAGPPTAIPATCVPCRQSVGAYVHGAAAPAPSCDTLSVRARSGPAEARLVDDLAREVGMGGVDAGVEDRNRVRPLPETPAAW